MSGRRAHRTLQPSPTRLLRWAIRYIAENNKTLRDCHMNPRTKRVEPAEVRREVESVDRWLARARKAVK